ncbi:MAG TPA: FAD-dependent oxidoreductase [Vicinamibacterales bacterium]|jgi:ferredoxin-NADP reductase
MAVAQKLAAVVERIVPHGEQVYTIDLRPERPAPRFRAGQFLHLAIDPYDPAGFWPESRVFSIASSPDSRDRLRITYAVHGRFTARMERELVEGRDVWIKMPYGDFVIDAAGDVVLFAGGTGVTAFTAFLEGLGSSSQRVLLGYGARTEQLLLYRDVVERSRSHAPALDVAYFTEHSPSAPTRGDSSAPMRGRVSVDALWPRVRRPAESSYYISGPPGMLKGIAADLRARGISQEAIHIDAWE